MLLEQKTTDFLNSSHRQHRFREVAVHRQQSEAFASALGLMVTNLTVGKRNMRMLKRKF